MEVGAVHASLGCRVGDIVLNETLGEVGFFRG